MTNPQHSDFGTRERHRHDRIEVRPIEPGPGMATVDAAYVVEPTELHRALERGHLGSEPDCKRRFEAGMWLAQCHEAAGLRRQVTPAYDPSGVRADADSAISEAQEWNERAYREAVRAMPARLREAVIDLAVQDKPVRNPVRVKDGLDKLAEFRGIE